jgi:hypothetical protein
MPDALWHRRQVQALIDLGHSPLDAERFVAKAELLTVIDGRLDVAQIQALAVITDADIADARADWYANRAVPARYKRLLDAQVKVAVQEGGPGSGNWGHAGIPGQRGGSAPKGGEGAAMSLKTGKTADERRAEAKAGGYALHGRSESEIEKSMRSEAGEAEKAAQAARDAGNAEEAHAIGEYAESIRASLEEERSANQALWDKTGKTPDKATEDDWAETAHRLERDANKAYEKYTKDGIQLAVDIKRGARDSGYANVGGEVVQVKRGQFSRREAARMQGEVWSRAKEELSGRMGGLLQKAGYKPTEIARASFEQRQKLLKEVGQGDLMRSGRGKPTTIDDVSPDARGRVRSQVSPILANRCGMAGDSPLNLPGIAAFDKMQLADRIKATKVGDYGE